MFDNLSKQCKNLAKEVGINQTMDCTDHINQPKFCQCKTKLKREAITWLAETAEKMKNACARYPWWTYPVYFNQSLDQVIDDVINGTHQFSPMDEFLGCDDELHRVLRHQDRPVLHLLHTLIKPVFKRITSRYCNHLKGSSEINRISKFVEKALAPGLYEYIIRYDVKSFFASINHQKLIELVHQHFDDPFLITYLEAIITIAIDRDGLIRLSNKGLPYKRPLKQLSVHPTCHSEEPFRGLFSKLNSKSGVYVC